MERLHDVEFAGWFRSLSPVLVTLICLALRGFRRRRFSPKKRPAKAELVISVADDVLREQPATARSQQQPRRDKATARLEWWQRLNQVKPKLVLPERRIQPGSGDATPTRDVIPESYRAVAALAEDRLRRGRDWLVRDSDYGPAPAHAGVKAQVNPAIVKATRSVLGQTDLASYLACDPRRIVLLLETPKYGTLGELCTEFAGLQYSQQVVIPQADLGHYFEMMRNSDYYPGVRAQRLDHWLCANAAVGFECLVAFLDFECRLAGSVSARLCPAADVMRYFRFGYPAKPASVLALTVGLEDPAPTPETVDEFVRTEAILNGYTVELVQTWKYRMVTLLYIVRCE